LSKVNFKNFALKANLNQIISD